ncbi:MAG: RHS repeat-associated core domain-containing protein, partial [Gemmatimonadaceae bacterium]
DWGEFPYTRPGQATHTWQGTVLVDKPDATGTYYRRNRSYDPNTARFTQEDPIGLAGGLNVYRFNGGDPVNFSDPFGLCYHGEGKAAQANRTQSNVAACISEPGLEGPGMADPLLLVGGLEEEEGAAAGEVEVSSGPMQAMERQLARDGPKSVRSTIKTLTNNIAEHEAKISEAAQRGGNTSSMEREIRAWRETLKAAQKVLEKNPCVSTSVRTSHTYSR